MKTKITIITPTPPDISAFGVRSLSSYLRSMGFDTRLIFLPGSIGKLKKGEDFVYAYDAGVLERIVELCKGSDIVGVSFMSNYFDRAIQVTQALKKNLGSIIVWGGIHPTTSPEQALVYADAVCIGEGEETLLELAQRKERNEDFSDVKGMWFKKDGAVIRNRLRDSFIDLDKLPFFDFSLKDHYLLDMRTNRIIPLDMAAFRDVLPRLPHPDGKLRIAYRTMTDRGCPHKCSYCNISNQKEMYEKVGLKYFRARSVENFITEIEDIKRRFPFIGAVQFFDDTFFARPVHEIEEFARLYKERIGLPFYTQASPTTISERKMEHLVNAGMVYVEMGVQTGSARIKQLYNRTESNEKIVEAARTISRYVPRIFPPDYHIILDNPWETDEDTMDTVRLLMQLPKPYGLCISSLVFFPQTFLYHKAKKEGLIKDDASDIYRRPFFVSPNRSYPNFLIYLLTFQHFPRTILNVLGRQPVVNFLSRTDLSFLYNIGCRIGEFIRFIFKGIKVIWSHDWERIRLFLNKMRMNDPIVDGRKR
ncbi:MAG: B12-binding domain-containing radical SAM protein [Deltaproteobacteria bacterium]|nr:B12-binding domain-containing radical SAM protein [Deltaproteobacteria bacterium]